MRSFCIINTAFLLDLIHRTRKYRLHSVGLKSTKEKRFDGDRWDLFITFYGKLISFRPLFVILCCFYTALCLVKKLEFFKCEVSQTSVALTAAGLFNITPRLFPQVGLFRPHNGVSIIFFILILFKLYSIDSIMQLMSTTITYVIILWQFQSSEKHHH